MKECSLEPARPIADSLRASLSADRGGSLSVGKTNALFGSSGAAFGGSGA